MLVSTSLSKTRSQGGLKEAAHRDLVERSSCQPVSPQQIVDRSSVVLVMSLCRVILPRTLNCEGLLLFELACRAQLVRKANRW